MVSSSDRVRWFCFGEWQTVCEGSLGKTHNHDVGLENSSVFQVIRDGTTSNTCVTSSFEIVVKRGRLEVL